MLLRSATMIGNAVCPLMAMALTAGYMREIAGSVTA